MATYIPAETIVIPRQKLLPPRLEMVGDPRLDQGLGVLNMEAIGLLVDEAGEPLLDDNGKEQFRGTGKVISLRIEEQIGRVCAGISTEQVLAYFAALFDEEVVK
jgi:hypothetical protein